jgi:hypothetical protein
MLHCTSPIVLGMAFCLDPGEPLAAIFVAAKLGRDPIRLLGGRLARVRYAPIAIEFRSAAK